MLTLEGEVDDVMPNRFDAGTIPKTQEQDQLRFEPEGSHLVLLHLLQRLDQATNRGIVQADSPADLTERIPMLEIGLSHGNIACGL